MSRVHFASIMGAFLVSYIAFGGAAKYTVPSLIKMSRQTGPDRRSRCPLNASVEIFGDHWSLLVIRDLMFRGAHTFTDLMDGGEGIASNILTDRLQKLVAREIVDKVRMATDRRKYFYRLTEKGIDLAPALLELILWGDHYEGSDAPAAVIREMKSCRDGFLLKIRKQWEKDRKPLDAETSDD